MLNFADFLDCVDSKSSDFIQMTCQQFLKLNKGHSQAKLQRAKKRLAKMRVLQFRRGSRELFFKTRHIDVEFQQLDFLKAKVKLPVTLAPPRLGNRGISASKNRDIVDRLVPLMPENCRAFWLNLDSADTQDLYDNDQELE